MKTRKLAIAILIFIVVLMIPIFLNGVHAESLGYLKIIKERNVGNVTYKHQLYSDNTSDTKNIWKLVSCDEKGTQVNTIPDIYCLRAGLGFTSESSNKKVVEYTQSFKEYSELVRYFKELKSSTIIFNEENKQDFDAVMWILDNMLLEGASDSEVEAYLKQYAGYTDETLNKADDRQNVLSRADIEAIQQLAIWYFTNKDQDAYNKSSLPVMHLQITGDALYEEETYSTYEQLFNGKGPNGLEHYGTQRKERASELYSNLITTAKEVTANGKYETKRDITVYLAGGDAASEQPVVVVKEKQEVDVALRKFISAKNGEKLEGENSRAPQVDTTKLNKVVDGKIQTTSEYNHTKRPLRVEIGDIVTYTIRIYNEGEVDTYITEITDYLPDYLEFYDEAEDAMWVIDEATGKIATSTENCIVTGVGGKIQESEKGRRLEEVLIPKAEYRPETDDYELSYVDVEIQCKVMPTAPFNKNITNLAQITEMEDGNRVPLEKDRDSTPNGEFILPEESKKPEYKEEESDKDYVPGQEDDDDFEKVFVPTPEIDMALRKFISAVNEEKLEGEKSREPKVNTDGLKLGEETAVYNHSKVPVEVKVGDIVTYTIRLYNEGDVDGRVKEVEDNIAKYLKYTGYGEDLNKEWWTEAEGTEYNTVKTNEACIVVNVGGKTDPNSVGKKLSEVIIPAYNKEEDVLSYVDIEIHCEVLPIERTTKITNIAEITKESDEYGNEVPEDRDSTPNGNLEVPNADKLPEYKDDEIEKEYIPGQEDDDDFEKVVVKVPAADMVLRKFITEVDGEKIEESREPKVNTAPIDESRDTTSEYEHSKKPVVVKKGSLVTYTIRVYNEGEVDGYVSEITDYLPEYLIYLPDNEINKKYGWEYNSETREVKTTITAKDNEAGEELYKDRDIGRLLLAYNGDGELDYLDVEIVCKVDENAQGKGILTNLAQITKETDEEGRNLPEDKDSTPNGDFNLPSDEDRPKYKDEESQKPYVPGQEDDDDFEKVMVKPDFDLALRKFITKVGDLSVNNRYPQVNYDKENNKLSYEHTKNPVDVAKDDVVIYTIRIYNEGEADGYAEEITDDVPEDLEFLPDNEVNKQYRWVMLDENEEVTEDVTKAKYIVTDYLSEEQEKDTGRSNLLKAFDKEKDISDGNPDYRDVEIAFKVTYEATSAEETRHVIVNTAQISKDSDDDIDSKPNRDEVYNHDDDSDNEDDIDYDQVKVTYFDLSLLKWVTTTIVNLDGKTEEIPSGHTAETSKDEDPVKLEIPAKKINKISVKYRYTIRITNEGDIAGYATEITDYVPEGLKFVASDNPDWYEKGNGIIATKKLENTLLNPGEYAEVEVVLTWINSKENFGRKDNIAEISEDKNSKGAPDIDSTPDNRKDEEDDIDDAPVILAVKTGETQIYIGLTMIMLITFAGGVGLIKKYVLE